MKNLAGETKADLDILHELNEAGIRIIEGPRSKGEVPYTLTGSLGDWKFARAWYYWMASDQKGNGLPFEVATELHNKEYRTNEEHILQPYGKVIRVDGNCGCPAPSGNVRSYHIDTQEGLDEFAGTLRSYYNIRHSGSCPTKVRLLQDRINAMYAQWETDQIVDDVEWMKKMPTIEYDNTTVTELLVAIKNGNEVASIAKKWKNNQNDSRRIAQYFFKDGQITGFNYGNISGPGQALNRGPEIDERLRAHYEELFYFRQQATESLELCLRELEKPGPEYTGRTDGSVTVRLTRTAR